MFLLYIMSYLDRINVSFAGLEMNKDLGFSDSVFGFGAGVFFIGYFLFGIPSNIMVAKIGARKWISLIMIVWGIISMSFALVKGSTVFYALRFLLGVAEAGFFPGMILYLTYWFPKRERGLAVANFMTAIPVAGVLGGLIASQLLAMHGVAGLAGWKWLFLITGAPSVVLGFVVWFVLCDRPQQARWLCDTEREVLLQRLAADHVDIPPDEKAGLHSVVFDWRVWLFALIYFCITVGMYGFQLWLPQMIHSVGSGLGTTETALLSIIPPIFQGLGMVLIAKNSDKTGERSIHFAVATAIAALGLLGSGFFHEDLVISLVWMSVAAFGIWGTVGPFWALPTARLSPAKAAAGIALINSVGNLGGFVGPSAIGWLKIQTGGFLLPLIAVSCSLLLAGTLVFSTRKFTS